MTNLTNPIVGLLLLQRKGTISDMPQGVLSFLFISMQLKHADNRFSIYHQPLLSPTELLIQSGKQTATHIKSQV